MLLTICWITVTGGTSSRTIISDRPDVREPNIGNHHDCGSSSLRPQSQHVRLTFQTFVILTATESTLSWLQTSCGFIPPILPTRTCRGFSIEAEDGILCGMKHNAGTGVTNMLFRRRRGRYLDGKCKACRYRKGKVVPRSRLAAFRIRCIMSRGVNGGSG